MRFALRLAPPWDTMGAMSTWILGLDLRPTSQGALEVAAWLGTHLPDGEERRFIAMHVVDDTTMRRALRAEDYDQVLAEARARATEVVRTHLGEEVEVQVVEGPHPEEQLAAAADSRGAEGLIIGRQAWRGQERLVALGRVARRLVRALPRPVWIAPPDLRRDEIGDGPILVAVDVDDDSLAALAEAVSLGERVGRQVQVVHVVELPEPWGEPYAKLPRLLQEARDQIFAERRPEVLAWLAKAGHERLHLHLEEGPMVAQICALADACDAALIVAGSRHLSLLQRVFHSSVGTALASASRRPVVLVPPASAKA